jgi:ABC-2 type transport system permease protein
MPVFLLFLMGYTLCFELKDLPLAVFDMDQSEASRSYIEAVDNTSYFHVKHYPTDYSQANNLLARGITRCVIIIPPGFSRGIKEYRPVNIQTLVDGSYTTAALFIVNYLSAINATYSAEMTTSFLKKKGLNVNFEPISLSSRAWYNQALNEFTFVITGVFGLSMMAFIPLLSALAIVREKESGSIQQIFASPVKSYEYIAGKMSPYVIFLTLDFLLVILIGLWWFDLPFRGNFFILSVATFLMVFACVAIGFFISTLTKSQLTAMLFGVIFTLMPALLFSDSVTPIQNSSEGWRLYSCLFPTRYYTAICRAQILKGSDFFSYYENALSLVGYCVAIFLVCAWRVRAKKI